ncbi:L,D-transpeptidase family protein [Skermania sp. ID1734]|uniref:L,D-transpeptidase n=1 Tax=Skermania sp. ID1734 TaxID=2597516 RepID=UPI00117E7E7D|nr:Ig-like domain-containing protein [Skermania sp. ID1734]TSD96135.1 L,D-transpeptidase family protein [Skermania sp. ID1734]
MYRWRRWLGVFWALSMVAVLVGCSSGNKTASPAAQASPAVIAVTPDGSKPINVTDPINVTVKDGVLKTVTVTNSAGKVVQGVMTPDNLTWKTTEPLGYDKTYKVHAEAANAKGDVVTKDVDIQTLAPSDQTQVYLQTTNGVPLADATYGVGIVIVAHFDEPITNKDAAQRAMTVTTNPPVAGAWHWFDNQNAHWRPEHYYAPGTTVKVSAKLYGVQVGDGLFGQSDVDASFRIGDAHISTADDNTKMVTVTDNGKVVRTMPTSMGRGGSETVGGRTISFWTPSGIYTVLGKANPVVMDSATYGLPVNSRLGYKEKIPWATQISPDGIYLHQLNATVWAQGNTDTSHGCLNLNSDNAEWFYNFSQIGDVVQIVNSGGPPQDPTNNGDWTIPWSQWTANS